MKNCSHKSCVQKNPQPLEAFRKHKSAKDGRSSNCISCHRRLNKENTKKWKLLNKDKNAKLSNDKYHRREKATPQWLTKDQREEMHQLYKTARFLTHHMKTKFVVDHILPIKGEDVSGLHVPWNLRLVTADENVRKYNKVY